MTGSMQGMDSKNYAGGKASSFWNLRKLWTRAIEHVRPRRQRSYESKHNDMIFTDWIEDIKSYPELPEVTTSPYPIYRYRSDSELELVVSSEGQQEVMSLLEVISAPCVTMCPMKHFGPLLW